MFYIAEIEAQLRPGRLSAQSIDFIKKEIRAQMSSGVGISLLFIPFSRGFKSLGFSRVSAHVENFSSYT